MSEKILSIVVPCLNEEEVLPLFYEETKKVEQQIEGLKFEYVFVDDGSKDKTVEILKDFAKKDEYVKYISFSRNFGKEGAMLSGFELSSGDYVVIMDADLQDPPKMLIDMYKYICEGYDIVATRRVNRKGDPVIRSLFAKAFYKIVNHISDVPIPDGSRDYRMMKRKVINAIIDMPEYNRFSKGIFSFVGFKTKMLPYVNTPRAAGKTSWSFKKLFKYSIEGIVSFSVQPLKLATRFGILAILVSIGLIIYAIVMHFTNPNSVEGWSSLACMVSFFGGVQLICLGILGEYLSKVYMEVKKRPKYIISETNIEIKDYNKEIEEK